MLNPEMRRSDRLAFPELGTFHVLLRVGRILDKGCGL
jgi:hypothetical protein